MSTDPGRSASRRSCAASTTARAPTGLRRITGPIEAIAAIEVFRHHRLRHETIVVALDGSARMRWVVVVAGTDHPDAVLDVIERLVDACDHTVEQFLIASIRPGLDTQIDDVDRWLEICHLAARRGIGILEWFVYGTHRSCPRALLGEPPRWQQPGGR